MGRPSLTTRGLLDLFSNLHTEIEWNTQPSVPDWIITLLWTIPSSTLDSRITPPWTATIPSIIPPMLQVVLSLILAPFLPDSISSSSSRSWKWKATFIARFSAGVSGVWALMVLYHSPSMCSDLMLTYSPSAQHLILFSLGVHIAEAVDMLINLHPSMLMVHHILVIICFAGALLTDKAIGFAVLSLVTEINAVLNKTRILHIITNTPKDSIEYIWNAYLNIFTFFIRILIIVWMNNQCFLYYGVLPLPFLLSCSAGLLIVNIWNLSVFRQLVQKDVFRKVKSS